MEILKERDLIWNILYYIQSVRTIVLHMESVMRDSVYVTRDSTQLTFRKLVVQRRAVKEMEDAN